MGKFVDGIPQIIARNISSSNSSKIGGVAIGTAGTGNYSGYTLAGGDDFLGPLSIMGEEKVGGKYLVPAPSGAVARLRPSPNNQRYYADPLHTGYLDANRGVPVGYTNVMTQNSSILNLKARAAEGSESSLSDSLALVVAAAWSTPFLTFTPPAIIEFYAKFPAGAPAGVHPTIWVIQTSPANTQNGLEFDIAEASSQYPSFNQNTWGTIAGWGPGGTAGTATFGQSFSLQSLNLLDGNFHLYTCIMDTTGAATYVDGTLAHKYTNASTAVSAAPYQIIMSNTTLNSSYNGDTGVTVATWQTLGDPGAVFSIDYYRVWLPNAKYPSQIIKPSAIPQYLKFDYNAAISYTYPAADAIWGAGNYDSDYLQALRNEDFEPGGDSSGTAIYTQFPAGLSLSGRVLSGSLTGTTNKPGRLNLIAIATKAGGSLNYTFQDYIDIGPTVTTGTINITGGTGGSHDLYTECNCGTLLPQTITVSGLPTGVFYDGVSVISWGTSGYVNGTTPITIKVTNSSGQVATATPNIVVTGGAVGVNILGNATLVIDPAWPISIIAGAVVTPSVQGVVGVSILGNASVAPIPAFPAPITGSASVTPTVSSGGVGVNIVGSAAVSANVWIIEGAVTATNTTPSVTISTVNPNEIICLSVFMSSSTVITVSSISSTSGLTWTKRKAQPFLTSDDTWEFWYAKAASALTSEVITVTPSATVIAARMTVFGVAGANQTTPWDTNVSLPASSQGTTVTTLTETISTSNASDLILAGVRSSANMGTITLPSGFTEIPLVGGIGTATDVSYEVVGATQSSQNITYSWTTSAPAVAMIVDALQHA